MTSDLVRLMNSGENGEGEAAIRAYPRIAIGSRRLSPAERNRDEIVAYGRDSLFERLASSYPNFIPGFTGAYP